MIKFLKIAFTVQISTKFLIMPNGVILKKTCLSLQFTFSESSLELSLAVCIILVQDFSSMCFNMLWTFTHDQVSKAFPELMGWKNKYIDIEIRVYMWGCFLRNSMICSLEAEKQGADRIAQSIKVWRLEELAL
jgi:hypothetical protein